MISSIVPRKLFRKCRVLCFPHFPRSTPWRNPEFCYEAPFSIDDLAQPIDAFVSNEVLEHIPLEALRGVVASAYRLLRSGGLAIHAIDYSDHYARGGGVSRYNFLRFSDAEWAPFNSGFQYVNRLRHSEYLEIFKTAGFEILSDEPYSEEIPEDIQAALASRFRPFDLDDLSVMRSRIVARKR